MPRLQVVADHRHAFEVSGCAGPWAFPGRPYTREAAAPAREARAQADNEVVERISAVHATDRTCGAPPVTAELNDGLPAERQSGPRAGRPGDGRP